MYRFDVYAGIVVVFIALLATSSCMQVSTARAAFVESCPTQAIADMEAEFGAGTSTRTTCLQNTKEIKILLAWNSSVINKRSGAGHQPHSTRQMLQNYTNMYGLSASKARDMIVVGYGPGGRWLLTDDAYNLKYGVTTGNPSRTAVEFLLSFGVQVFMCQNTMRGNGWVSADLLPGVEMVPAGVVAVIDFASLGYMYAAP